MTQDDSAVEIDFNHLNQYVGGDISLTKEVFGMFQHQIELWLRALVVTADDEIWAGVTHSLKGSAKAVGAVALAELCERAEDLTGEGNRPGGREVAIQNIEFRVSRVIAEIQRWEYKQTIKAIKED